MRLPTLISLVLVFSLKFSHATEFVIIVKDAITHRPVSQASVFLAANGLSAHTDFKGRAKFSDLKQGHDMIIVKHIAYKDQQKRLDFFKSPSCVLRLVPASSLVGDVVVRAKRKLSDYSSIILTKQDFAPASAVQDLPYLLSALPSTTASSDAGHGVGYTYMRFRGQDVSRILFTINGIPFNDSDSQGAFFVNTPDLLSSSDEIEIRKGVGVSAERGALTPFGININVNTNKLKAKPFSIVDLYAGAFGTTKAMLNLGTGMLGNTSFTARLSKITSDGFIDRSGSKLSSYFLTSSYINAKSKIHLNIFGGSEVTGLAWAGVPESRLKSDTAAMQCYICDNALSAEDADNLLNSGARTYNPFTYENQTDNYVQNHYQLFYDYTFSSQLRSSVALYYTVGHGYFEELLKNQKLCEYKLEDVQVGETTISTTDLIDRKQMANGFYGLLYHFTYSLLHPTIVTYGGLANNYEGRYYNTVIWAKYFSNGHINHLYYDTNTNKLNIVQYLNLSTSLRDSWKFEANLQLRSVRYKLREAEVSTFTPTKYCFFNPSVIVAYTPNSFSEAYLLAGSAHNEPNRYDFLFAVGGELPRPERLIDLELGYNRSAKQYSLHTNIFGMFYGDQLASTGAVNSVGAPIRQNIPRSYRIGLEVYGKIKPITPLSIDLALGLSRNKIVKCEQYAYSYDANKEVNFKTLANVDLPYSPALTAYANGQYYILPFLSLSVAGTFVSKQYLNNAQSEEAILSPYFAVDLFLNYALVLSKGLSIDLDLGVFNVLDARYESNGYSLMAVKDSKLVFSNFYFPQAGIHFGAGLSIKFL